MELINFVLLISLQFGSSNESSTNHLLSSDTIDEQEYLVETSNHKPKKPIVVRLGK